MMQIPEELQELEKEKFSDSINILTIQEEVNRIINADKLQVLN